jgi:small subunit ribosomal protein S29
LGIKRAVPEERKTYDNAERKKLRDTIVLQNVNAPIIDLHELTKELSTHEPAVGSVFTFGSRDIDRLRALEAFQRNQDWKYFHKPSTVYRNESLQVGEMMRQVEGYQAEDGKNVEGKMKRVIFEGPKGSGKSVLLLQSMAWALQKGWLVVNIPNGMYLYSRDMECVN